MAYKLPDVLTEDEQQRLLAQPNPRYPTGERNKILMKLILDTGLRVNVPFRIEPDQWNNFKKIAEKQKYGGQNILIINENESKEKIGEMILEYTTRQNKRKPALKKALAQ